MAAAAACENGNLQAGGRREVIEHFPGALILYSDGSFQRLSDLDVPASAHFDTSGIATRDVVVDASKGIWARIFLPLSATKSPPKAAPLVLHFHGGGFCIGSPASPHVHRYCSHMARRSACIWISLHYRLAPENPLPAAYEDAYTALLWLRAQAGGAAYDLACNGGTELKDPWLAQYADLTSCFLAGDSSGGTMVHFLAARASGKDWSPLRIKGMLLMHPAFPQEKPRDSLELSNARVRFYHRSALPAGATFGHPLMNPIHPECKIQLSGLDLPPALVAVAEKDPLLPGDVAYYDALCASGHRAQLFQSQGVGHGFHTHLERAAPPAPADAVEMLERAVLDFINQNCS